MEENMNAGIKIGYAYVKPQEFGEVYSVEEALERATLFPELDLPMEVYGVGPNES